MIISERVTEKPSRSGVNIPDDFHQERIDSKSLGPKNPFTLANSKFLKKPEENATQTDEESDFRESFKESIKEFYMEEKENSGNFFIKS